MSTHRLTEWETAVSIARAKGEPAPALVLTLRDPDGTVSAELVVERGWRLVVSPNSEAENWGRVAPLFRMERIEPREDPS